MSNSNSLYDGYKDLSQNELNIKLEEACQQGRLDEVKYLLTSPDLNFHADINIDDGYPLRTACDGGYIDIVKYLLTSPDLKKKANIHLGNEAALNCACMGNHLEIVDYLLTSPELEEHASIHLGSHLTKASQHGNLEVIKYLLTSPKLKEHADIHKDSEAALKSACMYGHLNLVKYFLTSPDLNDHAHFTDEIVIDTIYFIQEDILRYFIFELEIEKTKNIENHLLKNDGYIFEKARNMFALRELNKQLEKELSSEATNKRKLKI